MQHAATLWHLEEAIGQTKNVVSIDCGELRLRFRCRLYLGEDFGLQLKRDLFPRLDDATAI
jgi:hypothetical protein